MINLDEGINVLSLFDGMSCGRVALEKLGIKIKNYFASEINPHAIKVALKNFPNTIQLGDVRGVITQDGYLLVAGERFKIHLIIGGSPCQGFSFAGKELNFEDPRSKLFFEYVRLKDALNPEFFFLENVNMRQEFQDIISGFMGVRPYDIDSSIVSAQKRRRLYWTNIPFFGIKEVNVGLHDIIELPGVSAGRMIGRRLNAEGKRADYDLSIKPVQRFEINKNPLKTNCLTTVEKDNVIIMADGSRRYLTVLECERLQTMPENYTEGVAKTHRLEMLGNGWTLKIIMGFFQGMLSQSSSIKSA